MQTPSFRRRRGLVGEASLGQVVAQVLLRQCSLGDQIARDAHAFVRGVCGRRAR
ncbi:hypothetical protein XaFJ1_GM001993 [Xanthomonas albilineans]|nr:hypothetical protein XaFJ1_GM001993 [Xanthomonas albilineans]